MLWSGTEVVTVMSPNPAVSGHSSRRDSTLYAFDPQGGTKWAVELFGDGMSEPCIERNLGDPQIATAASPSIDADGTIYVAPGQGLFKISIVGPNDVRFECRSYFFAVNPADRSYKWSVYRASEVR